MNLRCQCHWVVFLSFYSHNQILISYEYLYNNVTRYVDSVPCNDTNIILYQTSAAGPFSTKQAEYNVAKQVLYSPIPTQKTEIVL